MEQFLKTMGEYHNKMHDIVKELAVVSTNMKDILRQVDTQSEKHVKLDEKFDDLKEIQDQHVGAIMILKWVAGLTVTGILTFSGYSFGEMVNTRAWIAQTDQWKTYVEKGLK